MPDVKSCAVCQESMIRRRVAERIFGWTKREQLICKSCGEAGWTFKEQPDGSFKAITADAELADIPPQYTLPTVAPQIRPATGADIASCRTCNGFGGFRESQRR